MIQAISLLLVIVSVFGDKALAACGVSSLERPYHQRGQKYFYLVKLPQDLKDNRSIQGFRNLSTFRNRVKHKTSIEPYYLIKKQYEFYKDFPKDKKSYEKILSSKVGKIRPINCLEAYLMDAHLSQLSGKSEFQAYILSHSIEKNFLVIVNSIEKNYVEEDLRSRKALYNYLKKGWRLYLHLHNHPFSFNNPYGDIAGTLVPSWPDISMYRELYRRYGLKTAIVTNGFHSLELSSEEFNSF